MILSELDSESVASIFAVSQRGVVSSLGTQPSDIRWFLGVYGSEPVELQPTGDYVGRGERFPVLTIHMRPRQDPIIRADKFASSQAAVSDNQGVK